MQTNNAPNTNVNPLHQALSICESMQQRLMEDPYSELDPTQVLIEIQKIQQNLLLLIGNQAPEHPA